VETFGGAAEVQLFGHREEGAEVSDLHCPPPFMSRQENSIVD
jgi:hypothetical protein